MKLENDCKNTSKGGLIKENILENKDIFAILRILQILEISLDILFWMNSNKVGRILETLFMIVIINLSPIIVN